MGFLGRFIMMLFVSGLVQPLISDNRLDAELPVEIQFGRTEVAGDFISARELGIWASQRGWKVVPDCPLRELQNFEAEIVRQDGMHFQLQAPGRSRVFLYLDIVTFYPEGQHVRPCSTQQRAYEIASGIEMRFLDVIVNGEHLQTIYMGAEVFTGSPVIVPIEREVAGNRNLAITLRPSPGDPFFAVWDAFISREPTP